MLSPELNILQYAGIVLLSFTISTEAGAQKNDEIYWNSDLQINAFRFPLPDANQAPVYIDIDQDGDPDILQTLISNKIPVQWIDDDDDMTYGDSEGDMDNDCLMVDRDKNGEYGSYNDLAVDWADTDNDGKADMQVVVDNVSAEQSKDAYGGHYMWILDLDKDNIFNYIDWETMQLRCWLHDGQSHFYEDYSGKTAFLKVHSTPERINDPRLSWENPFLFYDPDHDGLTEMAIRLLDQFNHYQDTSSCLIPFSGRITYASLAFDLDNDNGPGNEFDYDFTLGFNGGGFNYRDQVHHFEHLRGLPETDTCFLNPRWRQLTELIYPDHASAPDLIFTRAKWKSARFVFDEDDDCSRWERVEFYDPLDLFRIGMYNNGLDNNRQADASGDRGEWDQDNSGKGQLYISRFDGRLHLYGAEWGAWRIDQNAWSYQGMGGIVDGYGPGRQQMIPEKYATIRYSDSDNNGFIDEIQYDLDGDTLFENTVRLKDMNIRDECRLINISEMSYDDLTKMYTVLSNNMWQNAMMALRVTEQRGLQTSCYALLKHPSSSDRNTTTAGGCSSIFSTI